MEAGVVSIPQWLRLCALLSGQHLFADQPMGKHECYALTLDPGISGLGGIETRNRSFKSDYRSTLVKSKLSFFTDSCSSLFLVLCPTFVWQAFSALFYCTLGCRISAT